MPIPGKICGAFGATERLYHERKKQGAWNRKYTGSLLPRGRGFPPTPALEQHSAGVGGRAETKHGNGRTRLPCFFSVSFGRRARTKSQENNSRYTFAGKLRIRHEASLSQRTLTCFWNHVRRADINPGTADGPGRWEDRKMGMNGLLPFIPIFRWAFDSESER
jgi:hypothetical protein